MHRVLRRPAHFLRGKLRRRGFDIVPYPAYGRALVELLQRLHVDCVLDVGAFIGEYGRMLRDLGYSGRIVGFEASSENYALLERESAGDPAWEARCVAVGSAPGTLELHLMGSAGSHSLLVPNTYAAGEMPRVFKERGMETVEVTTIDDVYDGATRGASSVFLKVDTQGFDLEVIRGAAASLERVAAVQVELSLQQTYEGQPGYRELLAELEGRGFSPALLFPTFSDKAGRIVECDCVLIRTSALAG